MTPDLIAQVLIGGPSVFVCVYLLARPDDFGHSEGFIRAAEARWWLAQMEVRQ